MKRRLDEALIRLEFCETRVLTEVSERPIIGMIAMYVTNLIPACKRIIEEFMVLQKKTCASSLPLKLVYRGISLVCAGSDEAGAQEDTEIEWSVQGVPGIIDDGGKHTASAGT